MAVEFVEETPKSQAPITEMDDNKSSSSGSQITDDVALKDSKSGRSSTETGSHASTGSSEADKFVRKESRHVLYLRVVVFFLLFAASTAVSLVVFFITSDGEDDNFQYVTACHEVTAFAREG